MRPSLLLYLTANDDVQRVAVGPALAALAVAAGWRFECYYDRLALGRHFGGGETSGLRPGFAGGTPLAGGRHTDQLCRLAGQYPTVVVGDGRSAMWGPLADAGSEPLVDSDDPATIYEAVCRRLDRRPPDTVYVVDAEPRLVTGLQTAPYLAPEFLSGPPALGIELSADADALGRLTDIGVHRFVGLWPEPARSARFPVRLEQPSGDVALDTYASFTSDLAGRYAAWGSGVLLADPDLTAAQLSRIAHRRLIPLYGRPQRAILQRAAASIRRAEEPVLGRQYDDDDFVELGRLGHGLQVVDPGPPFEASPGLAAALPRDIASAVEPADAELAGWADEGRILVTLCLWAGMIREVDAIPRLLDLVLDTGLRAGLIVTTETIRAGDALLPLAVEVDRGGLLGRLEPVLGSTGHGVAAEWDLPDGVLADRLVSACRSFAELPAPLRPRGWWPLLDTPLRRSVPPPVRLDGHPRLLFTRRAEVHVEGAEAAGGGGSRVHARRLAGEIVRRAGAEALFGERRPFDGRRPGAFEPRIGAAVADCGLEYMFTKAGFGRQRVLWRRDGFVALPFTAGHWDGWSPFYTVRRAGDIEAAERRLRLRRGPGWLVSTVDSPLFALAGEVWEHGAQLHRLAARVAGGDRLVNVTPSVLARYARLLDDRRLGS
ncbi:MAG TPA: hypothetical protein VNG13_12915 [Mycobacteriales bacterium]|nr:hypothetical protein [Mycobacteriales bacterium]